MDGTVVAHRSFEPRNRLEWICVTEKNESGEVARLERLNDDLKRSLRRCRDMLHDYEVRLTANSNEAAPPTEERQKDQA